MNVRMGKSGVGAIPVEASEAAAGSQRRAELPSSVAVRRIRTVRTVLALGFVAAVLFTRAAPAAEIEGVRFSDRVNVGASALQLHGTGLLRYRAIIKAYVAALYLDESFGGDATPSRVLADVPRRLEIEYFWAIPSDAFAKATIEGISRNTDPERFASLRRPIERINELYEGVEPGDRYSLTYLPGVGTELALNGRRLGLVEGADFSAALFAVWVGDEALDASLRRQLLARG